jgi:hypothetical protein
LVAANVTETGGMEPKVEGKSGTAPAMTDKEANLQGYIGRNCVLQGGDCLSGAPKPVAGFQTTTGTMNP